MEEKSTRLSENPILPKEREREEERDGERDREREEQVKNETEEKAGILTLKENSRFSPPHTSIPVS